MEVKPVQITAPRGLDWGPDPLMVTYKFWSFSPVSNFVKIHLNQGILKPRVILFHLVEIFVDVAHLLRGLKLFFQWE